MNNTVASIFVFGAVVAASSLGCSFDETRFQHDCPYRPDVGPETVCRDGSWVSASNGDADGTTEQEDPRIVRTDADVVGGECADDDECGGAVCVDGECVPCRSGQSLTTTESCGYKDRGSVQRVCRDNAWVDGECVNVWYRSCREYLEAHPDASNGAYELDPDGPMGRSPAREFGCIMTSENPDAKLGWTRLTVDHFESGTEGWQPDVGRTTCGAWGTILGGYGRLGSDTISKTFELPPVPGETVRLYLEFIEVDSWDQGSDYAVVEVDGEEIWRKDLRLGRGQQVCGTEWRDEKHRIVHDFEAPDQLPARYEVKVTGVTDEGTDNESFGIDNVVFFVR